MLGFLPPKTNLPLIPLSAQQAARILSTPENPYLTFPSRTKTQKRQEKTNKNRSTKTYLKMSYSDGSAVFLLSVTGQVATGRFQGGADDLVKCVLVEKRNFQPHNKISLLERRNRAEERLSVCLKLIYLAEKSQSS